MTSVHALSSPGPTRRALKPSTGIGPVSASTRLPGALVLSLDFEQHWGVRTRHSARSPYMRRIVGVRTVIPRLLELFDEFDVAATWATVGLLFAESREEVERYKPRVLPHYEDARLSSYQEPIGRDEMADPLHYAGSLVELIHRSPRQEIATHTFSHFFCGERGQTREAFEADIEAAVAIAAKRGVRIRSIVFPRNQINLEYADILLSHGITAYRGNPSKWMWRFTDTDDSRKWWKRIGRLIDSYVPIGSDGSLTWESVPQRAGLSDVAASWTLRSFDPRTKPLDVLRLERLRSAMRSAARSSRIFHIWWHPQNFGLHQAENLGFLRKILDEYRRCQERFGMISLNMADVDDLVRSQCIVGEGSDMR